MPVYVARQLSTPYNGLLLRKNSQRNELLSDVNNPTGCCYGLSKDIDRMEWH